MFIINQATSLTKEGKIVLGVLAVTLAALPLGLLYPMGAVAGAGAVLALIIALNYPEAFILLALATRFLKSVFIPGLAIGALGMTPYMSFEFLAIAGISWQIISKKRPLLLPKGAALLLFHMLFVTFSLFIVDDMRSALGAYLRLALDWLLVFLLVQYISDTKRLRTLFQFLLIQGLSMGLWGVASGVLGQIRSLRISQIFLWEQFQKNDYAAYLALVAVVALAIYLDAKNNMKRKVFATATLIAVPVAWIFTFSRGGFLAISTAIIVFLILEGYQKYILQAMRVLFVITVITIFSLAVSPTEMRALVIDGFRSIVGLEVTEQRHTETMEFRIELAQAAMGVLVDYPLLGVGYNQWQFYSPLKTRIYEAQTQEFREVGFSIHNIYLSMATNSGILALLSYLGFLFIQYRAAIASAKVADTETRTYINALLAALLGIQVALQFAPNAVWEWPIIGCVAGATMLTSYYRYLPLPAIYWAIDADETQTVQPWPS